MNFLTRNVWAFALAIIAIVAIAATALQATADDQAKPADQPTALDGKLFKVEESRSSGSVRTGGAFIPYDAVAGTLVVHPKKWDDAAPSDDKKKDDDSANPTP